MHKDDKRGNDASSSGAANVFTRIKNKSHYIHIFTHKIKMRKCRRSRAKQRRHEFHYSIYRHVATGTPPHTQNHTRARTAVNKRHAPQIRNFWFFPLLLWLPTFSLLLCPIHDAHTTYTHIYMYNEDDYTCKLTKKFHCKWPPTRCIIRKFQKFSTFSPFYIEEHL